MTVFYEEAIVIMIRELLIDLRTLIPRFCRFFEINRDAMRVSILLLYRTVSF